ncbi:MAG: trypsin-like peptidase domain-containing protein [Sphingopyxis sp.]|nr:trypsin-like peptidase domain-containing protein [Sphingopyxis sp.]
MAIDPIESTSVSGVILPDTWSNAKGHTMRLHRKAAVPEAAQAIADGSTDLLDGALLALQLHTEAASYMWGSAVLIAPGIALAAKHVVEAMVQQREALGGYSQIYAFNPCAAELQIWHVREIKCGSENDVALLTMHMGREDYGDLDFNVCRISARMPQIGEPILMAGFVADADSFPIAADPTSPIASSAKRMTSLGVVTEIYPMGRDQTRLPHSCIEVGVNVSGGMSGGPAFDKDGHLIGLVSSSIHSDDNSGPTWVSLLWNALLHSVSASWPPRYYPDDEFRLIDAPFLEVLGRDHLIIEPDGTLRYRMATD